MDVRQAVKKAAAKGQSTDTVMGHLTVGEIVVPKQFMENKDIAKYMKAMFEQNGVDINEFTVGNKANKKNPETGSPEFFKKFFKRIAAPVVKLFGGGGGGDGGAAAAQAEAARVARESEQRLAEQKASFERQQSELGTQAAASLRARRGRQRALLANFDQESTLG